MNRPKNRHSQIKRPNPLPTPGWEEVDRKDHAKMNLSLGNKMQAKPLELEQAFRGGGSKGIRQV